MSRNLNIVLTAGEASGDSLGARLMRSLKALHPDITFSGVGGPLMEAEGLVSLFPMHDLSLMGIMEILPRLRLILRRIRETAAFIARQKPDMVITIDSPDFSFRVAKAVQRTGSVTPVWVHYVAPSVWAWRPERARKVAGLYNGLLCLLPFEPPYFTKEGMSAAFTGHPAIGADVSGGPAFRERQGIPKDAFVLGVLFGSRGGELKRIGQVIRATVLKALASDKAPQSVHIVSPTLPHLRGRVEDLLKDMSCPVHITTTPGDKWPGFASMDAAIAVSGTVGLELAVAGVPHVIAYRINTLTWLMIKSQVKVKFAHLANILFDRMVVPEFIQLECRADGIAPGLVALFGGAKATEQKAAFGELRVMLAGAGTGAPSDQAARYVLGLLPG